MLIFTGVYIICGPHIYFAKHMYIICVYAGLCTILQVNGKKGRIGIVEKVQQTCKFKYCMVYIAICAYAIAILHEQWKCRDTPTSQCVTW